MRIRRSLTVGFLTLALAGSLAGTSPADAPRLTRLVDITATHHPGFDRVVFEFDQGLPAQERARYVSSLTQGESNLPLRVAGRAILSVTLRGVDAHNASGDSLLRRRTAYALPNVITVVQAEDFEGVVTFGVGLAARRDFTVTTLGRPSRVVVEIGTRFRRVAGQVYFRHATNATAVSRQARAANPPVDLLDRLFAGPTRREQRDGLSLVRSRASGFARVRVSRGVIRLQLTGGCDSGGSTFTIANEIMPMLRRLPTVDFVKIYDPMLQTQHPRGKSDSIPVCLEP